MNNIDVYVVMKRSKVLKIVNSIDVAFSFEFLVLLLLEFILLMKYGNDKALVKDPRIAIRMLEQDISSFRMVSLSVILVSQVREFVVNFKQNPD